MADAEYWTDLIPDKVFSRIRAFFSQEIKSKYGMTSLNFSTEESNQSNPIFPFVYVQQLESPEVGMTLANDEINGVLFSFQVDVTDNIKRERAKTVMSEVVRIMKKMRFTVVGMPAPSSSNGVHRMTARFRRTIGGNDPF